MAWRISTDPLLSEAPDPMRQPSDNPQRLRIEVRSSFWNSQTHFAKFSEAPGRGQKLFWEFSDNPSNLKPISETILIILRRSFKILRHSFEILRRSFEILERSFEILKRSLKFSDALLKFSEAPNHVLR